MIVIPGPVEFPMGSPLTEKDRFDHERQHRKRISRTFALAAKPVTVAEYRRFAPGYTFVAKYAPEPDCPVVSVSWFQAAAYCNWLSKEEGIPEEQWVYETDKKGQVVKIRENYLSLTGYRLPTEAEWEYACRAETGTSRSFGNQDELLGKNAWYLQNASDRSWPVGMKPGNNFGLFDMRGNVWNWCQEASVNYPTNAGVEALGDKE